jgi:hypothetical protein
MGNQLFDDGQDDGRDVVPEEPLEPSFLAAAREYHRPPEPPREAMWRAIQAERRVERATRPAPRRWVALAAAAAAQLAVGIGIGRVTWGGRESTGGATVASWGPAAAPARVNETAYRLATVEHLGQSEAFLTLFRAAVRSGGQERLTSVTARQLLATNRLLLDSPAGGDRRTRLLLEDLELVLAEIAQLAADPRPDDRELIREELDRGGVLSRLRTEVPAGTTLTRGDL